MLLPEVNEVIYINITEQSLLYNKHSIQVFSIPTYHVGFDEHVFGLFDSSVDSPTHKQSPEWTAAVFTTIEGT